MPVWTTRGSLRANGGREQEGQARQELTEKERKAVGKRLAQKRKAKIDSGSKRSYQPQTC